MGAHIAAEYAGSARGGLVESEQGVQQSGLARAVRSQQSDGAPGERCLQLLEDGAGAEAYFQAVQFDDGIHYLNDTSFASALFPVPAPKARFARWRGQEAYPTSSIDPSVRP